MSLFPAYSEAVADSGNISKDTWLQNSSFKISSPEQFQSFSDGESVSREGSQEKHCDEARSLVECKIKKSKKSKGSEKSASKDDAFYIDIKGTREFLMVKTISRPAVAKYKIRYYIHLHNHRKKKKFRRYFQHLAIQEAFADEECKPTQSEEKFNNTSNIDDSEKLEQELTQMNATYNKTLFNEPKNVEMWLKFIDFQDTFFKFEKTHKKGSVAKGLRANALRKIDILEKAISKNPTCEDLHRKRLQIMVNVYPSDELQKQLKDLLQKDQGNIILWQGYIEAFQCSMSHCNTSSVLSLYTDCLLTLHKIRRNTCFDNQVLEESILRILYQCGLFLKQSGLFEQLWTLLKMYLEMNLGKMVQNSFDIRVQINEAQLIELEEMVLKSQLPSHELWLRAEKLRESCHWLPVMSQCEDPQRIVLTEDVVELIQPITVNENTFRLTATILTLLKIPMLPCRHNTIQEFSLDYVPWALDSIETILPTFFPIYPVNVELDNSFIDIQLAVGPQYLKMLPGQEEYLNFILKVMQKCIESLQGDDQSSLIVWWLRFQRLLIILDNKQYFKLSTNIKKDIRSNVKNLLKKSENRSNKLFYAEYALIEKELKSKNACIDILQITLTSIKHPETIPLKIDESDAATCYSVRILVETLIDIEQNQKALNSLANFILGKPIQFECNPDEKEITRISLKFKHVSLQLVSQVESQKLLPVQHFLPIFLCDWIICNGWFVFLTKGPLECFAFLENILEHFEERTTENILQKEIIYEFYVAVLFKFCMKNNGYGLFKALDQVLYKAVQCFPNNLFLLSVLAKEQCLLNSLGPKWWKTKKLLLGSGHSLPVLMLVSITYRIISNLQEKLIDTITGGEININSTSLKNTMVSLFKAATKSNMCTRRCGLVWRLYLQFVHKYFDPKICRKVYYSAVEECPWLKVLYIDAAIYIPAELGQIQDLLIEKELRIHITPEELDILRD